MVAPPFNIAETVPADSDVVSTFPALERAYREIVESYLNTDHDPATGHHAAVGMVEQGADPANAANTGFLYTKDDGGDTELFYEDDAGTVVQLTEDGNAAGVPAGGIILWSGAVAAIPAGWALCDGTLGTPDLTDRFIVGAGDTYAVDATGGAATHDHGAATGSHVLLTTEIPAHTHGLLGTAIVAGGDSGATLVLDGDGSGSATAAAGGGGGHTHTITSGSSLPPYYALAYIMKL